MNAIDIDLFCSLFFLYIEIVKLVLAAVEVVEEPSEAFAYYGGQVFLENLRADIPATREPRATFALLPQVVLVAVGGVEDFKVASVAAGVSTLLISFCVLRSSLLYRSKAVASPFSKASSFFRLMSVSFVFKSSSLLVACSLFTIS